MNVPPPQAGPSSNVPNASISEIGSNSGWSQTSDTSDEDSGNEGNWDWLANEGCADEAYWEDDRAVDAWLARFPGGTSALYPQLFIVKQRRGKVLTPPRYPNADSLLRLPPEIRNRIYRHYFDRDEVKHPEESYAPFHNREGKAMPRICLGSDFVELKFWLSTALLQTSRQLRREAMSILFGSRVLTVEWLPLLPRFVKFLGMEGCAMIRYLDVWDTLNLQGENKNGYRDIITSVMHLSSLQHLRIVVCSGFSQSGIWSNRVQSWFDQGDWAHDKQLKEQAVPKIRSINIERHWPEYEVLKNLKAQKFTLTMTSFPLLGGKYIEFDRSHGAYPEISHCMQSRGITTQSEPSSARLSTSSLPAHGLETFKLIDSQPSHTTLTPNTEFDEDSDCSTWQETDALDNKTIPMYNFLREFFHNNPVIPGALQMPQSNFIGFPTARKSVGSIMQDCGFCYLSRRHCGYHAVPDQPPFEFKSLSDDAKEDDVKTLQTRFEHLSYVDMRTICRDIVQWMDHADSLANTGVPWDANATEFLKIAAIFDYLGWPEPPNSERLARLDAAAEAGWRGKKVDKEEVLVWDMLYREVHARYEDRYRSRAPAGGSWEEAYNAWR